MACPVGMHPGAGYPVHASSGHGVKVSQDPGSFGVPPCSFPVPSMPRHAPVPSLPCSFIFMAP